MKPDKSLALLVCYFGKLPWYFDYFVYSCKYNPTVDFFIITDNIDFCKPLPKNVNLIYKTLDEISILATERLGFPVCISYGYKLCDFKPAYGIIFSDILKGYDWWGHIDLDIIFGDIRTFMTDELLSSYDLVSVRPDWLPGCFLLFKNTEKTNTLFTHSKDFKKVFSNDKHYCFDETNFAHDDFTDGKSYLDVNTEIESMMHVVKRLEGAGYIKSYFDLHIIEGVPGKLKWENGKLYYRGKYEILLYHLISLKKSYTPKNNLIKIPGSFAISPSKIYNIKNSKIVVDGL
ncbi:DUF6625 family protein [Mucilaginibacter ginsenosidivorans]|uniref:Glycosyl transferase n=1 Tax=Mucilaginibacter ginsenosidivorans TaxID=398053 RepID=A0A5B8URH4_9SPHI|nr:DUF6625 family protein [Mucilaginibacter ginsenosidivorans]QEC61670.1 hypothetical protein FRZ54_03420 [Mucilaginibacter ginsenosidivorans]